MGFNPLTVVLTVIGGLIVAGLVGWIKRPRLVVLLPRMFTYSQITNRGHLVELSVFNRGFKTEEAVEVHLNHTYSYEVLGSNSQDALIKGNKLQIARIGPSDEVTVLLLVENGLFRSDDIIQCLSKETKGKTVLKLEEVTPTGPQRIGLVAALIGIPLLLYALDYGLDYLISSNKTKSSVNKVVNSKTDKPTKVNGWEIPNFYISTSGALVEYFADKKISIDILVPNRKDTLVSIPIQFANHTDDKIIKFSASMQSLESTKRFNPYELSTGEILLSPGKTSTHTIKVVIPKDSKDKFEKLVFIEGFIKTMDGDTLTVNKTYPIEH